MSSYRPVIEYSIMCDSLLIVLYYIRDVRNREMGDVIAIPIFGLYSIV